MVADRGLNFFAGRRGPLLGRIMTFGRSRLHRRVAEVFGFVGELEFVGGRKPGTNVQENRIRIGWPVRTRFPFHGRRVLDHSGKRSPPCKSGLGWLVGSWVAKNCHFDDLGIF
jgi:hypothetical protein